MGALKDSTQTGKGVVRAAPPPLGEIKYTQSPCSRAKDRSPLFSIITLTVSRWGVVHPVEERTTYPCVRIRIAFFGILWDSSFP